MAVRFALVVAVFSCAPCLGDVAGASDKPSKRREHWAYRPLLAPNVPPVRDEAWSDLAIDRYILAGLEANDLRPAPDADPEVLMRRVYYALTGLPPTPEEIEQFVAKPSPVAYRRLVDRLLDSPRFGERWGRHWLDVVRFGESSTLRGTVFTQAWRYRDYVIDAWNRDLPFNRFIMEQVAGDLLPAETWQEHRRQMTATSVLALGNTNFENQDKVQLRMDVVDEQLEVIGRAFLAQTMGCARCHDHKFDPIPTRDYYALAGILRNTKTLEHANVSRWLDLPLPSDPASEEQIREHENAVQQLQRQITAVKQLLATDPSQHASGPKSVPIDQLAGIVLDNTTAVLQGDWANSSNAPRFVGNGYLHGLNLGGSQQKVTFETQMPADGEYEVRVSYSPHPNRATTTPVTVYWANGQKTTRINQRTIPPIDRLFTSLGKFAFLRNEPVRVVVGTKGSDGYVIADSVQFLSESDLKQLAVQATPSPTAGGKEQQDRLATSQRELASLEAELKKRQASAPPRDLVMSVLEESEIGNTHIHIRGSVHKLGAEVPRGFLRVASYGPSIDFMDHESGRRQLGQWLSGNSNPLTARVIINRLWHWLYGVGLVRTPDNFGTVGELPSHPELLDHLAFQFQREGWSIKSMLRQMVLSRTYQMSSHGTPAAGDVENRLLWRMHRRRLEAECIRDTMLMVSGRLDLQMYGPTFLPDRKEDYDFHYEGLRRSVYAPAFRNALLDIFEVFDFADPSIVVGRRSVSTVPTQALFMLNNPFVIQQSRWAAERLWNELPTATDEQRIERAYRLVLGRRPRAAEMRLGLEYVGEADASTRLDIWGELYQTLFASVDFRYVE
jgi:hypothetical protein